MTVQVADRAKIAIKANPDLLRWVWRRREMPLKRMRVVRPGDDAVIEGYPRSSNTFATHAFILAQGEGVKVGNHLHSPGQFALARRYGVPAMLVLREPVAAAMSMAIFDPRHSPELALYRYVAFHRPLIGIEDAFVVAPFEEVTTDFNRSIERLNTRFGTAFEPYRGTGDAVFAHMDQERERRALAFGDGHRDPLQFSKPTPEKEARKDAMRRAFEDPRLASLRQQATRLYDRLMQRA